MSAQEVLQQLMQAGKIGGQSIVSVATYPDKFVFTCSNSIVTVRTK